MKLTRLVFLSLLASLMILPVLSAAGQGRDRAQRIERLDRGRDLSARRERTRTIDRERQGRTRDRADDDTNTRDAQTDDTEMRQADAAASADENDAILYMEDKGYRVRRGEILALNISDAALRAAKSAGMTIVREKSLSAETTLTVLRGGNFDDPGGMIVRLQDIDPAGIFTPNHVYRANGQAPQAKLIPAVARVDLAAPTHPRRIGMIDGGIDMSHPLLAPMQGDTANFTGGEAASSRHGMAVALRLAETLTTHASDVSVSLYAANVMSGEDARWATADALSGAIAWQTEIETEVLNISLAGPPNQIVEVLLQQYRLRGGVVVAAVGNGGPLSMEIYPAAYADVIGVTAVDSTGEIYEYATRGGHVDIAAPGVDLEIIGLDPAEPVSGTSFASPYIAALILVTGQSVEALSQTSADHGTPGRDDTYGWGETRFPVTEIALVAVGE